MTITLRALPSVSVITPSYNHGEFITETIESVRIQDYPGGVEHIVMDGQSSDDTLRILRNYDPMRGFRWISQADRGQSDAINKGMRMSGGEIATWLNSDDYLCPGALRAIGSVFAQDHDVDVVYGTGLKVDREGRTLKEVAYQPYTSGFFKHALTILQPTVFFRREFFLRIGGVDPQLDYAMDWDLFLRMADKGRFAAIPDRIAKLRCHEAQKTARGGWPRDGEIARIGRRHNGLMDRNNLVYHVHLGIGRLSQSTRVRSIVDRFLRYIWGPRGYMIQFWPP